MPCALAHLKQAALLCGFWAMACAAQTDSGETTAQDLRWQAGLGYQHYREPLMQLRGPEIGLGVQWAASPSLVLEAQWWGGQQRYSSPQSGTLSGVANHEFRTLALYRLGDADAWLPNPQLGLAGHFVYNDLRGQTSTQSQGYERLSQQLWLPLRWSSSLPWPQLGPQASLQWELAWLLRGRQTSRLSQASPHYTDAHNTQRRGLYMQLSAVQDRAEAHAEPYLRVTHVGRSDLQTLSSGQRVYEPSNTRVQVGVNWAW